MRAGDEWLFVSFEGKVHPVDVSGPEIRFGEPWSLLDDADRAESWRIGGLQHLAVHEAGGACTRGSSRRTLPHRTRRRGLDYDIASRRRSGVLLGSGLTIYGFRSARATGTGADCSGHLRRPLSPIQSRRR